MREISRNTDKTRRKWDLFQYYQVTGKLILSIAFYIILHGISTHQLRVLTKSG